MSARKGRVMEYNDLSEEQKAKAAKCKTPEEIIALAKEDGYELSAEEFEAISGGDKHWIDQMNYYCTCKKCN